MEIYLLDSGWIHHFRMLPSPFENPFILKSILNWFKPRCLFAAELKGILQKLLKTSGFTNERSSGRMNKKQRGAALSKVFQLWKQTTSQALTFGL